LEESQMGIMTDMEYPIYGKYFLRNYFWNNLLCPKIIIMRRRSTLYIYMCVLDLKIS
jgi:hypothetical protein